MLYLAENIEISYAWEKFIRNLLIYGISISKVWTCWSTKMEKALSRKFQYAMLLTAYQFDWLHSKIEGGFYLIRSGLNWNKVNFRIILSFVKIFQFLIEWIESRIKKCNKFTGQESSIYIIQNLKIPRKFHFLVWWKRLMQSNASIIFIAF